ncbi:hypothetical protein C5167_019990 [Papaver somniferum]|uniref:UvrD-like helicase ATP-binding domain-containing protein n=1 Tax=Papaver somniferum TaxID=3469 RepID=A0A4Y7IUV5_PAPSO|nr:hypothetical protein C5167_019990 [Papaver somniferum]
MCAYFLAYFFSQFYLRKKSSVENKPTDMHDIDDTNEFSTIPDSFMDLPLDCYPLVITFQKFLLMLDRFNDVREFYAENTGTTRMFALNAFIRSKEVNYDRFNSFYWAHFNCHLTRKLDSSTVFVEIMSHIKGGLIAGTVPNGKLSRGNYLLLSEGRVSTLSKDVREMIYDIFLDYEKKKLLNGEFDLADLVMDLHRRLRKGSYRGDQMDFVYIDEVQDLTMRQAALFKYICQNFEEGFVFSGDTAQTIARGIDFRFQDIRSLFYNEFISEPRSDFTGKAKEKVHCSVSDYFQLDQNFRTHAAPVLLKSVNDENAIVTNFGNTGSTGGSLVGFGAEQVILVRDDSVKKEVSDLIGKQALVLTLVECKGLEFQDVLLYDFFGTSPLKNQWRVIYGYLEESDLFHCTEHKSFPSFCASKHKILCSELKQLYVALTRARQRLWIYENIDRFSMPIFDYWKKLGVVQVRHLDESLAQTMRVGSSKEEWCSRGIKNCGESRLEDAANCFSLAGCWSIAAEVYCRANCLLKCLTVCTKGNLFEVGLQFLEKWKAGGIFDADAAEIQGMKELKQEFLEKCAFHYHQVKDTKVEFGNCVEAANSAKLRGNLLLGAEILEKGEHYEEASRIILQYVLVNSLWITGSKGWPLKKFSNKEELLTKSKLIAKTRNDLFYELICVVASSLSDKDSSLAEMGDCLATSERLGHLGAEILYLRKILDFHLKVRLGKYEQDEIVVLDSMKHAALVIARKRVSTQTLIYFWNIWREKILSILMFLVSIGTIHEKDYKGCEEFCLDYLGVCKTVQNGSSIYTLLNSDAYWMKNVCHRSVGRNGETVTVDVHQFVSAAQSYWVSEVTCLGMNLLEKLNSLYGFYVGKSSSMFKHCIDSGIVKLSFLLQIRKSLAKTAKKDYSSLVLRLFILVCLNAEDHFDLLCGLVINDDTFSFLPLEFREILSLARPSDNPYERVSSEVDYNNLRKVCAEVLKIIENPLVIVYSGKNRPTFSCPDAIFIDMELILCREDILDILNLKRTECVQQDAVIELTAGRPSDKNVSSRNIETIIHCSQPSSSFSEGEQFIENEGEHVNGLQGGYRTFNVGLLIRLLDAAIAKSNLNASSVAEDRRFVTEAEIMLGELKQLLAAIRVSCAREEDLQPILQRFAVLLRKWKAKAMETRLSQLSAPFFSMLMVPNALVGFSQATVSSKSSKKKEKSRLGKDKKGKSKKTSYLADYKTGRLVGALLLKANAAAA